MNSPTRIEHDLIGAAKGDYARLHPLDHVNLSQSTNDVYPTAVKLALQFGIRRLLAEMAGLRKEFEAKAAEFSDVLKIGRTQLQDAGAFVQLSGVLKRVAVKLSKVCNDLRLLSSGPRAGIGEINLPAVQAGSSIMPGKVNPVIPEVVNQVAFEVIGNDITVTMAAEGGQLQLNAFEPIIAHSLFKSISHLAAACRALAERCVRGITANREHARQLLDNSTALVTALNPYIGYVRASEIAREALATGRRVYDLVLEKKLMTREDLDALLRPEVLTQPHFSTVHRPKVGP